MIESKYLKENLENIQKLMTIPALKNFETRSLGKLLRLSKVGISFWPAAAMKKEGKPLIPSPQKQITKM